ncbi:DUF4835 family protein [candidate division KSB1 bacterium]|nr:DUF4835 family protein [candidate division KSB1 bacterium]
MSRQSYMFQPVLIPLILVCLFMTGMVNNLLFAQQITANVSLILERLPLIKQEKLKDFSDAIEIYLSDYDWTGEDFEEPVPITIQIFLQDNSASYESRYSGTFLISNGSDLQYYDKYWKFPYNEGDPLVHQDNLYEPFTGFLDFYIYLILGGEYDKLGKLAGAPYLERAKQIADQGMFDARFTHGWKERIALMDYVLGEEYKPFREMKDLYFLGLSYDGEEQETALKYCGMAIGALEKILRRDPEHKDAQNFLKAHYIEIIELFKGKNDVLRRMIYIDPDHKGAYEQHLE